MRPTKAVILCGGRGTRLHEETEYRPKPMVQIGERPILWHIMKTFAHYGVKHFILCLGYKGDMIKEYFRNYMWNVGDVTLQLGPRPNIQFQDAHDEEDWTVTLAETGLDSLTAYRLYQTRRYIGEDESFFFTYGDGVGNINLDGVIEQHTRNQRVATLTAAHPPGRFGELGLAGGNGNLVEHFNEKPQVEGGYINAGYMVLSARIFNYLTADPNVMFEQEPIRKVAQDGQLDAYLHDGFWQPMDTYMEYKMLNRMWDAGNAPWRIW